MFQSKKEPMLEANPYDGYIILHENGIKIYLKYSCMSALYEDSTTGKTKVEVGNFIHIVDERIDQIIRTVNDNEYIRLHIH